MCAHLRFTYIKLVECKGQQWRQNVSKFCGQILCRFVIIIYTVFVIGLRSFCVNKSIHLLIRKTLRTLETGLVENVFIFE